MSRKGGRRGWTSISWLILKGDRNAILSVFWEMSETRDTHLPYSKKWSWRQGEIREKERENRRKSERGRETWQRWWWSWEEILKTNIYKVLPLSIIFEHVIIHCLVSLLDIPVPSFLVFFVPSWRVLLHFPPVLSKLRNQLVICSRGREWVLPNEEMKRRRHSLLECSIEHVSVSFTS